jgi:hypothetical protein
LEARLHLLELADYAERENNRMADAVRIEQGQVVVRAPRRNNPWEELGLPLVRLHVTGVVRALAGSLDCLAGVVIGVAALPLSILKADFLRTRSSLNRLMAILPLQEPQYVQANFGFQLTDLIDTAGPRGWLDWTLAFRNMLIHRGRRIEVGQLVPRVPVLLAADGRPILRARSVTQLPLDPQRSDVEVFLDPAATPVLTEDSEQTLEGLLESTKTLVNGVSRALLEMWRWRRANPAALPQPREQWPQGVSTESVRFLGYAPGAYPYNPNMFMTHPDIVHRLRVAALSDDARDQWVGFD